MACGAVMALAWQQVRNAVNRAVAVKKCLAMRFPMPPLAGLVSFRPTRGNGHGMSTRLRNALLTDAVVVAGWLVLGQTLIPTQDRALWFFLGVPLTAALAAVSHYLWRDRYVGRRQAERQRPRYGARVG